MRRMFIKGRIVIYSLENGYICKIHKIIGRPIKNVAYLVEKRLGLQIVDY